MPKNDPNHEQCITAEMEEVSLDYTGHIRNDVVTGAEMICREAAYSTTSWQATVKKAVIAALVFTPGVW